MTNPQHRFVFRLCRRMISGAARLLPLSHRAQWEEEWQGELDYKWEQMTKWRRLNPLHKLHFLFQTLGAVGDALWLRQQFTVNSDFLLDIRHALRLLRKNPGFTLVAVLTLALGIGANTAIFSVINTALLQPLPYHDSGQVAYIVSWNLKRDRMTFNLSLGDYLTLKEQNQTFDQVGFHRYWSANLTGAGIPERLQAYRVSANLFSLLGVEPLHGRNFSLSESELGSDNVVILSHRYWARRFGSDAEIVGQTITLNESPYTVVGVMPPKFEFPQLNFIGDLWTPMQFNPARTEHNQRISLVVSGRVKSGIPLARAQADVDTIMARLAQDLPKTHADVGARVKPLQDFLTERLRPGLLLLMVAVGFVLLIACLNVANLILMRSITREKEMGIRTALGAGRARLIRQMLAESVVLFTLGGLASLALAHWGLAVIRSAIPSFIQRTVPGLLEIGLDGQTFTFALGLSILAGVVFGLIPALQSSRVEVQEHLREGGRSSTGSYRQRLRSALVVGEIALTLVLLVTTGLLVRSFQKLLEVEPGFNPQKLLTLRVTLPSGRYPGRTEVSNFYSQAIERVNNLPGVQSAALVNRLPFSTSNSARSFTIEGEPLPGPNDVPRSDFRLASAAYFQTLGIPLLQGRAFDPNDTEDAPGVVVINRSLARRYFPEENPLGRRLRIGGVDSQDPWRTIIGVVGNVKHWDLRLEPESEIYLPVTQAMSLSMSFAVRTQADPGLMAGAVRSVIQTIDPSLPVFDINTMDTMVRQSLAAHTYAMYLMMVFAAVAITLAAVGLYGVISYSVSRRTHEIGVRLALGAGHGSIIKMVLSQGFALVLLGIGIGLAGAVALSRFLESLLFGISATDPVTMVGVPLLLSLVALVACYLPARRATKVDPMVALRYE